MIPLPWNATTVPHCVLEVTQRCNLFCKACYREKIDITKSLDDIQRDIAILEDHQRVQTISIAGGEPTLHPELEQIVRLIHGRGHKVSLVTNGLLLDDALLARLKPAGLDIVMVHIDEGQERPDLPDNPTIDDINALRRAVARRIAAHGIDVGMCLTIYREHWANLRATIECVTSNPDINFVFATHAANIADIASHSALAGQHRLPEPYRAAPTRNSDVLAFFREHFGLECFAYIPPSQGGPAEPPCVSYYIPVLHRPHANYLYPLRSGRLDAAIIRLSYRLQGKYPYYIRSHWGVLALQLLSNGLATGSVFRALRFLLAAGRPGTTLRVKRLVFENAPVVLQDGSVNCCDFCPNSTVRNGKVMPVCLADHLEPLTTCQSAVNVGDAPVPVN